MPKLLTNYVPVSNETLVEFANSVVKQTTTSTFFNGDGSKLAESLKIALGALILLLAETTNPTQAQNAQRDEQRQLVRNQLGLLAKQLNINYEGQAPALLSSGLPLADASPSAHPLNGDAVPTNVALTDAPLAGYLSLGFKRAKGAALTLIRYTTDLTLPEENWLVAIGGGRERMLGPFESGTKVAAKVACPTASTLEPEYSAVVTRIVQ